MLDDRRAFDSLRKIEIDNGGHRMTRVAARAAQRLLAKSVASGSGTRPGSQLHRDLAEAICWEVVDHHFFGRARELLIQHRFGDAASERQWEQVVKGAMQLPLSRLASGFASDPTAQRLRAPRRSDKRLSTKQMLDEPLTGTTDGPP
ncbi:MAG: hypothetical protein HY673_22245 [Chloroflexi bacterium]|nr:hypothetical protein [Chloroflexota bacterium]